MSDEEIERIARELQAQPLTFPGTVQPWDYITEKSKEFWREKARKGERASSRPGEASKLTG